MLARSPVAWPPDYAAIYAERQRRLLALREGGPRMQIGAREYYRDRPVEFIEHWLDTFDPRNAGTGRLSRMPFVLFDKQREWIEFIYACVRGEANGLNVKSRDMGATWGAIGATVHLFCCWEDSVVGWGSRKAAQVDRIGDMTSIFEKIRFAMDCVPRELWPEGFAGRDSMHYMKISAGSRSIVGESGDDIGRGARTLVYFKDEAAHYEHPESIEAALSDTARVQIDISSVNGLGNVFHRKYESGVIWEPGRRVVRDRVNVLVMDWSDHPAKTREWYDERERRAESEGLLHVFRQEVDRSFAASVEGTIIPAAWVKSAIDAHLQFPDMLTCEGPSAGLDVADGGGDRNALAARTGVVLDLVEEWGERDTGVTTRRAIAGIRDRGRIALQYDCVGVGAGVKAEYNRLRDDDLVPPGVSLEPWSAGAKVLRPEEHVVPDDPESPLNGDFFYNLKAQAWWDLRQRFERTHRAVTSGVRYPPEQMISIDSRLPLLRKLEKELSQPTIGPGTRMKMTIDKAPQGTRSPNLADAVVMCCFPLETQSYDSSLDWVGELERTASPSRGWASQLSGVAHR